MSDPLNLELRQLRYFVAVAEERHFGRAAVRLRIAQPGLSQQIKHLEQSIGVSLLVRDKRQVAVTEEGEVLLHYARLVIEMAERAVESTRAAARGKTGIIKLSAYNLGSFPAARDLVGAFEERYPHVQIELVPGFVRQSMEDLARRVVDLAVVVAPFEPPVGAEYIPLGTLEPIVVLPVAHRLAQLERVPRRELLEETVYLWPWKLNPPLVERMRTEFFGEAEPHELIEEADLAKTLGLVADGKGITITNPVFAQLEPTKVVFRRLEDPAPEFEYGLVWLEPFVAPLAKAFVELACELTLHH